MNFTGIPVPGSKAWSEKKKKIFMQGPDKISKKNFFLFVCCWVGAKTRKSLFLVDFIAVGDCIYSITFFNHYGAIPTAYDGDNSVKYIKLVLQFCTTNDIECVDTVKYKGSWPFTYFVHFKVIK